VSAHTRLRLRSPRGIIAWVLDDWYRGVGRSQVRRTYLFPVLWDKLGDDQMTGVLFLELQVFVVLNISYVVHRVETRSLLHVYCTVCNGKRSQ
jgi:hypothetical protein